MLEEMKLIREDIAHALITTWLDTHASWPLVPEEKKNPKLYMSQPLITSPTTPE